MTGFGVLIAIAIPLLVSFVGARLMYQLAGRHHVGRLLADLPPSDRVPLNQRFGGYDLAAVARHWAPLFNDEHAGTCEVRYLKMDLLFPFFYSGAFAVGVLILASLAEGSFLVAVGLALIVISITWLSDMTEGLVQVTLLQRYLVGGESELNETWINVASAATRIKWWSFIAASVVVGLMAVAVLIGF